MCIAEPETTTASTTEDRVQNGRYTAIKLFHCERLHILSKTDMDLDAELRNPCKGPAWDQTYVKWNEAGPLVRQLYEDAAVASNNAGHNVVIGSHIALNDEEPDDPIEGVDARSADEDAPAAHPMPDAPCVQAVTTNSSLAPVALDALVNSDMSLKQLSQRWARRTKMVADPGPIRICPYRTSCRQRGIKPLTPGFVRTDLCGNTSNSCSPSTCLPKRYMCHCGSRVYHVPCASKYVPSKGLLARTSKSAGSLCLGHTTYHPSITCSSSMWRTARSTVSLCDCHRRAGPG